MFSKDDLVKLTGDPKPGVQGTYESSAVIAEVLERRGYRLVKFMTKRRKES